MEGIRNRRKQTSSFQFPCIVWYCIVCIVLYVLYSNSVLCIYLYCKGSHDLLVLVACQIVTLHWIALQVRTSDARLSQMQKTMSDLRRELETSRNEVRQKLEVNSKLTVEIGVLKKQTRDAQDQVPTQIHSYIQQCVKIIGTRQRNYES